MIMRAMTVLAGPVRVVSALTNYTFGSEASGASVGIAVEWRIVMHEVNHHVLYARVRAPNYGFVHNGGDVCAVGGMSYALDPRPSGHRVSAGMRNAAASTRSAKSCSGRWTCVALTSSRWRLPT